MSFLTRVTFLHYSLAFYLHSILDSIFYSFSNLGLLDSTAYFIINYRFITFNIIDNTLNTLNLIYIIMLIKNNKKNIQFSEKMPPKFDPTEIKIIKPRAVGGEVGATSSLAPKVRYS